MSYRWRDPTSLRWRLAARIGPEWVALALSVVVVIAVAVLSGVGPFA